jgi:small-conductance mechanosensitive channel
MVDDKSGAKLDGVVRHITPRYTVIRQRNSTNCLVPNSMIITKVVRNWHYSRTFIAFEDIYVTVPQTVPADFVRKLLLQVVDEHPYVLKNPTPLVRLVDFADNGYQFMIRGFLSSDKVMDKWDIESQIRLGVVRKLGEVGIPLASPIRVVLPANSIDPKPGQGTGAPDQA